MEKHPLDKIDLEILTCLKENARMKASDISKRINLSVSAVIERIKKLETNGIIEKYTITLNQKHLGNDLIALMEVSLEHPKYFDVFAEMVRETESIQSCYYLTGEYDFMLKIFTDSSVSLEKLHRKVKSVEGVQSTRTHFVLTSVKSNSSVIPDFDNE